QSIPVSSKIRFPHLHRHIHGHAGLNLLSVKINCLGDRETVLPAVGQFARGRRPSSSTCLVSQDGHIRKGLHHLYKKGGGAVTGSIGQYDDFALKPASSAGRKGKGRPLGKVLRTGTCLSAFFSVSHLLVGKTGCQFPGITQIPAPVVSDIDDNP